MREEFKKHEVGSDGWVKPASGERVLIRFKPLFDEDEEVKELFSEQELAQMQKYDFCLVTYFDAGSYNEVERFYAPGEQKEMLQDFLMNRMYLQVMSEDGFYIEIPDKNRTQSTYRKIDLDQIDCWYNLPE